MRVPLIHFWLREVLKPRVFSRLGKQLDHKLEKKLRTHCHDINRTEVISSHDELGIMLKEQDKLCMIDEKVTEHASKKAKTKIFKTKTI